MLTVRSWRLVGAVLLLVGGNVTASVGGASSGSAARTFVPAATAWPPAVTRIQGADRYGTSVALSQASFQPGVPVAYVATGANSPDALSGAAAAAQDKGPLLLVRPTSLPPGLAEELTRLAPGRIVVQGGPGAVSDAVVTELKAAVWAPDFRQRPSRPYHPPAPSHLRFVPAHRDHQCRDCDDDVLRALAQTLSATVSRRSTLLLTGIAHHNGAF